MMRTLLYKELVSIRPFLLLILFLAALDWVFILLTEYPDQFDLARALNQEDSEFSLFPMFVIAMAMAASLLVREREEGTLDFLDGLPVSRTRIFLGKFGVALGALWVLPLSSLAAAVTFHGISRTSLNPGFHWDVLLALTLIEVAMCFVYLSIGLALSFLRRFGYLVLAILFWVYILLREMEAPFVPLFNLFSIGERVFEGQHLLFPTEHLLVQLGLGVVCWLIAWFGFLALGDVTGRWSAAFSRMRGKGLILGGATFLAALGWLGLLVFWGARDLNPEDEPKVVYQSWSTARARTAQYQFLYPENLSKAAEDLVEAADGVHETVRQFFKAEPFTNVVVDLAGDMPRHAGLAYWKKIRMNLTPGADLQELKSVLGHETAHLFIDQASESRLFDQFNSTRFFHEGLASYVEYHLFLSAEKLDRLRRVAAVLRARDEAEFEELIDSQLLSRKRDTDLVYPLGEMFVQAIVDLYGSNAPANITRSFAREGAPEKLEGYELWQDLFQACGYDLSEVVDAFFSLLDEAAAEHQEFVQSLPRLRGAVEHEPGRIGIRPLYEGRVPGMIVCRFRSRGDDPDRFYEQSFRDGSGIFWVDRQRYRGRTFWYQLGIHTPEASQPIYEPWIEVPLGTGLR